MRTPLARDGGRGPERVPWPGSLNSNADLRDYISVDAQSRQKCRAVRGIAVG